MKLSELIILSKAGYTKKDIEKLTKEEAEATTKELESKKEEEEKAKEEEKKQASEKENKISFRPSAEQQQPIGAHRRLRQTAHEPAVYPCGTAEPDRGADQRDIRGRKIHHRG